MGPRPTSVTVLAIIGIVLSALGLCGLAFNAITSTVNVMGPNPMMDELRADPAFIVTTIITTVLGAALTLILLAGSIGSLALRPWARKAMIVYSWAAIVNVVLSTVFTVAYMMPFIMGPAIDRAAPRMIPAAVTGARIGGYLGGCAGILGLILPIFILIYYNKTHVKNAFQGIFPAEQAAPSDWSPPV